MDITSQLIDGKKLGCKKTYRYGEDSGLEVECCDLFTYQCWSLEIWKKSHKRIESTWDNFRKESQFNIFLMSKPFVASNFCFWIFHEQEKNDTFIG